MRTPEYNKFNWQIQAVCNIFEEDDIQDTLIEKYNRLDIEDSTLYDTDENPYFTNGEVGVLTEPYQRLMFAWACRYSEKELLESLSLADCGEIKKIMLDPSMCMNKYYLQHWIEEGTVKSLSDFIYNNKYKVYIDLSEYGYISRKLCRLGLLSDEEGEEDND